ncbi:Beta-1,2-xylosyltransferase [Lachnellula hyalina]|uniref:Beta-1,2-xylosyltransferase n=1 Tax=Lachnellula hyalina TaxID=1316788 RepID=A0A8H8TXC5_9HELO|nr:Beta-1,2-xylosyltransferase [Lachnellula hyalina]TVY25377.1 Beta-1,2-xylosyltransferase [Lachnellula hyalina]
MRSRQSLLLLVLLAFAGCTLLYLRNQASYGLGVSTPHSPVDGTPDRKDAPATAPTTPSPPRSPASHPVWQLISDAEKDYRAMLGRQSKTLEEAVAEYRRRYGIHPPPNFDKWYDFAKKKNVQLIDEYDSIQHSLNPFWGLKPKTIRARAQEALGFDANNLIGALIRNGAVKKIDGGGEWQMDATVGMMKGFIKYLPDMDLCFNIHDEPRVVIPFDDMTRLMKTAMEVKKPAAKAVVDARNSWSKRPSDLSDGSRFADVRKTRFNVYAHQPTWTESRISCPPDSPARADLEDGPKVDNFESYAVGELGFVSNQTAFSDICQSPSFSETFGFFERPNAFNIVHDLFPVFSQSKISSYSDILYPSPWYWAGKVPYTESDDMPWAQKEDKFWWRGSTTGGFSRDGGWRRQHRQHVVQKVNAGDQAKILVNNGQGNEEHWEVKSLPRSEFKEIMDISFSHVGQCDQGDCDAQREFFDIKKNAKQTEAWSYKYLLDMDGNAFSGRFYAFLKSRSLVYKLAVFREWHNEWLRPWVHFVPLSLRGDEWVEAVRWFAGEPSGKKEAERLALQGREWADKVLRNEDLEVWFFRLLLEYGRLIDDDREIIGYTTPSLSTSKSTPAV